MLRKGGKFKSVIIALTVCFLLLVPALAFACWIDPRVCAHDDDENRPDNTWAPTHGSLYTGQVGSEYRYIELWWNWSYFSNIKGLKYKLNGSRDYNEALEVETVFYNYDGKAYCKEYQGFWTTNQPRAYRDTQVSDKSNEINFCIGCADANQFQENNYYYYYIKAKVNSSSGSKVKVGAQRSCRCPSYCYSTYCVFRECAENYAFLIPYSEVWAPGSEYW
ncbi:MAG: hypothetical protein AB1374_12800 [Bacillota bacterium]